jgi:hypothetical protein
LRWLEKLNQKSQKTNRWMNKNDLIFDWSNTEAHWGWKWTAVLIVALGFAFLYSLFSVQFDHKDVAPLRSASILYLSDDKESRLWRMQAEEDGPFPGGLEISGLNDPLNELGEASLSEDDSWNSYEVSMRSLRIDSFINEHRISAQGQRVFPRNFKSVEALNEQPKTELVMRPILIPYNKESEKWLPTDLPPIHLELKEELASAEWRFVLNLRDDGSVMECLSLSGGREEGLKVITDWLQGLNFQKSDEQERWMGLRIDFLNERSHGTDPE